MVTDNPRRSGVMRCAERSATARYSATIEGRAVKKIVFDEFGNQSGGARTRRAEAVRRRL